MYLEKPVVEITTVSVGCGYVNISWNVTGNNDECSVFYYNVTSSYVTMDNHVMKSVITMMNSANIAGLPGETQINITVAAVGVMQVVFSVDSAFVETVPFESTYICTVHTFL